MCIFLQTEEPLEQAIKFLRPLQNLLPECVETHTVAYKIYSRKGSDFVMIVIVLNQGQENVLSLGVIRS